MMHPRYVYKLYLALSCLCGMTWGAFISTIELGMFGILGTIAGSFVIGAHLQRWFIPRFTAYIVDYLKTEGAE